MALPSGLLSSCTMCVELSTDGTTWTDFSDYLTVIEPGAVTRDTAEQAVFGEDGKATGVGKMNPIEVTVRSVYVDSTATTNPFSFIWAQWTSECGGALAVRWAPAGCATTNQVFSTATATGHYSRLISQTPPGGDAEDVNVIMWEAIVRAPQLYRATYA
jgi:hypothetical protein